MISGWFTNRSLSVVGIATIGIAHLAAMLGSLFPRSDGRKFDRDQPVTSRTTATWSITEAGWALPASPITFAGTPATVTRGGTSFTTTEPAPIRAQSPTLMLPR